MNTNAFYHLHFQITRFEEIMATEQNIVHQHNTRHRGTFVIFLDSSCSNQMHTQCLFGEPQSMMGLFFPSSMCFSSGKRKNICMETQGGGLKMHQGFLLSNKVPSVYEQSHKINKKYKIIKINRLIFKAGIKYEIIQTKL